MNSKQLKKSLSEACVTAALVAGLMTGAAGTALVLPFGSAQAAVSEKSVRYFEKAKRYATKGDFNAAVIQLKNAIRTDGDNIEARFQLAQIYLSRGNAQGAEKEFQAALGRGYEPLKIVPGLAQAFLVQGKFQQLLDVFGEQAFDAVTFNGSAAVNKDARAMLWVYRAQAMSNLSQPDEASAALEAARALAPEMAQIYVVSSWLKQASGDLVGAEALTDVALKSAPDNVEALKQKAELRRLAGDPQAAIDLATRALAQNKFRRAPRITRALALAAMGNMDEARGDAQVLLENNAGDPMGAFVNGWSLAYSGDYKEALAALAAGQGLDGFPPALYLGAVLHLRQSEFEQARSKIGRYLAINPANRKARLVAAGISYQSGNFDEAVKALEPLYLEDREDVQVMTMFASALEKSGQSGRAAILYDEAINLSPDNSSLQLRAAQAKIGSGNLEAGMDDLVALTGSTTSGKQAATLLFLTRLRSTDFSGAEKALGSLEAMSGKTAQTENFRASLSLMQNDFTGAEGHLNQALKLQDDFPAARLNLARLFARQNDVKASKAAYEDLLERRPGYLPAIKGLIELAQENKDNKTVLALTDEAVRLDPENEKAHVLRLQHLIAMGSFDKALVAARDFIGALPDSLLAYDALARAQIASGDMVSATMTYQQLASRFSDNPAVHFRLAQVLIAREKNTDAMFALEKVIALEPTNIKVRRQRVAMEQKVHGASRAVEMARKMFVSKSEAVVLGQALMTLGEKDEGLALVRSGFAAHPDKAGLAVLSGALDQGGAREEATKLISEWTKTHPGDTDIRMVFFSRVIAEEKWQKAIVLGESLNQDTKQNPVVLNNLAWVYEKAGRIDDAKAAARQAVELRPNVAEIADTYGWILYDHGDPAEAESILAKAAALVPARKDIQYHYAAALAKVGKTKAARARLKEILASEEAFPGKDEASSLLKALN